jgi:Zn-dependent peptidase ImmA (M78 family)
VLGRPVSDLFREEEEELVLLYRAAVDQAAPPAVLDKFERFCRSYREVEEIVDVADSLIPPPDYSYFAGARSNPDQYARQVAESERERLGLGQRDPIDNIFKLLEDQGVRILFDTIDGHEVFGISAYSRRYGLCILLNAVNTLERQIFSLAHEYGHLLLHRALFRTTTPAVGVDKESEVETMANTFAANFLVPEKGLRDAFLKDVGREKLSLEDIVFLKKYFKVSAQMMLRRLRDLQLIRDDDAKRLQAEIAARVAAHQEFVPLSEDLKADWHEVSRFQHLVKKVALQEMVSLGKLAQMLGVDVVDARKKVQKWRREMMLAQA